VLQSDQPATIPTSPGVYEWRDATGSLLYVGKAKNLKARLSSYFANPATLHPRTAKMVALATSLTWLELPSELDSLLVEQHLIATHQPRFNVRLKDDSSYPFIALSTDHPTRVFITRNPHTPNARLLGPYPKTPNLKDSATDLAKHLGLATCTPSTLSNATRTKKPCLLFDLGSCSGPCVNDVPDYDARVKTFEQTLNGSDASVATQLRTAMLDASSAHHYESAARLRDTLASIESLAEANHVTAAPSLSADVISLASATTQAAVTHMRVRLGRITGFSTFELTDLPVELLDQSTTSADLLALALEQIYATTPASDMPSLFLLGELPSQPESVRDFLARRSTKRPTLSVPSRGARHDLVAMAQANAESALARWQLRRAHDIDARSQALNDLTTTLELPRVPLRMECYDMAHLQGTNYVGSMVVFDDGLPKKSHYRTFKLRHVPGNNDLAAMREVLTRRLSKLVTPPQSDDPDSVKPTTDESFKAVPDLLVIDGGPTQLAVVVEVLQSLGLYDQIPVVSLAKRLEEVYRPNHAEPVMLEAHSEALYLFQRLRDEAHRVANSTHAKLRAKTMTASSLDAIPGLGPKRRARLLEHFGTLEALVRASKTDLAELTWLPAASQDALYQALHQGDSDAR